MSFLYPQYLHLLWLLTVPLALWLFRKQAQRLPVSTLLFFRLLAYEHQESAWWRSIKRWLSLLLTLGVLLLGILALARPTWSAGISTAPAVVILIDQSASMAAEDAGETRLQLAQRHVLQRLQSLPVSTKISLLSYAQQVQPLVSRSTQRYELVRQIQSLRSLPQESHVAEALSFAQRLSALDPGAELWHYSDTIAAGTPSSFHQTAVTQVQNVGLTAFQVRPAPLEPSKLEALLEITAAKANAGRLSVQLELRTAERLIALRELELQPGQSLPLILPLEASAGSAVLEAELYCAGDQLGWDNAAALPLPKRKVLTIAYVCKGPDPFTQLALQSLVESGKLQLLHYTPQQWPLSTAPDVYVFEGWTPAKLPLNKPALYLTPQQFSKELKVERLTHPLPVTDLRAPQPQHPVLYAVNATRLSLTQTVSLSELPLGMESLWSVDTDSLLSAGEIHGQRSIITCFSPRLSESLGMLPQYPLLLGNAIYWCAAQTHQSTPWLQHPGDILPTDSALDWRAWNGKQFISAVTPVVHGRTKLEHLGAYRAGEQQGTVQLASKQETDLPLQQATAHAAQPLPSSSLVSFSSWQSLLWLALALLLLDNYLFHCKTVY